MHSKAKDLLKLPVLLQPSFPPVISVYAVWFLTCLQGQGDGNFMISFNLFFCMLCHQKSSKLILMMPVHISMKLYCYILCWMWKNFSQFPKFIRLRGLDWRLKLLLSHASFITLAWNQIFNQSLKKFDAHFPFYLITI